MEKQIKIFLKSKTAKIPTKGSKEAVGFDVYIDLASKAKEQFHGNEDQFEDFLHQFRFQVPPQEVMMLSTGFCVELPPEIEMSMCSRSSLFLKKILVQGIVDPDYRGEVHVMFYNLGKEAFELHHHMRIAQAIFKRTINSDHLFFEVSSFNELTSTERGKQGFGSSGI